ncbi:pyridoxal phosphate-dependent aminotransferase [Terrabacter terrigena]|uniref:Aminotransferase n=1 Tax=Terrabacter terrigena TaxID=574718 RepID=A0ABW3MTB7_9MICO
MAVPAPRIRDMKRSGIREIMDLAAQRSDVLHLEVGQPDFATPTHIVEAACAAATQGYTTYTANKGLLEVRESITAKLKRDNAIDVAADDVVISCGAVNALFESLVALVSPGDAILLPDPGWPNYEMMADTLSAQVSRYPLLPDEGYIPDLERLDALAAEPGAKVLIINSPGNPTGAVFPRWVIEELVDIARRHDLYLISDECYEQIVFEGEHVSPGSLEHDGRVLSVFSMSKSYAMTGWRMGYVAGESSLIDLVAKVQEPVVSCATSVTQKAGQAALEGDQSCVREMTASYRARRDVVVDLLRSGGLLINEPKGAFYILADISAASSDSYAFARRLVAEKGVAVAPGLTFGPAGAGVVRLSLATDLDQLRTGTQRLVEAVSQWRNA